MYGRTKTLEADEMIKDLCRLHRPDAVVNQILKERNAAANTPGHHSSHPVVVEEPPTIEVFNQTGSYPVDQQDDS